MPSRPSGGGRLVRLESQVQRVLAELVAREVKDPRVGPLTITQVKLAPDLSIARVYYVPFGGGAGADIEEGLAAAAGFLRGAPACAMRRSWNSSSMIPSTAPSA
jgi:ribosome-binding factor A